MAACSPWARRVSGGVSVSVGGIRQSWYFWKANYLLITAKLSLELKSVAFDEKIEFKTQFLPFFYIFTFYRKTINSTF